MGLLSFIFVLFFVEIVSECPSAHLVASSKVLSDSNLPWPTMKLQQLLHRIGATEI